MLTSNREIFRKYTTDETFSRIGRESTVCEMFLERAKKYSSLPALAEEGRSLTYGELEGEVALFRTLLAGAGLKRGDRVGLLSPNSIEFVKAFLAAETLGITVAVLPAQLPKEAVYGCSKMFALKALLFSPALKESVSLVKGEGSIPVIDITTNGSAPTDACEVDGKDGCVIMFTGGTTGKSKGALLSNKAIMTGTINGCFGIGEIFNQRYLLVLPLSHVFGLVRNLMTCLYTGSAMWICKNNKDMFRDVAVFRPTIIVMVPALAEMALMLSKKFGKNMLGPDMKTIICGAAAVAPYLIGEYRKEGIKLLPGYGLTESANLVSGNPETEAKPESVGIMYEGQDYKIVNGELWLRGDNMLDEYVGSPEKAYNEEGYFQTGDLVKVDEDGFLYITGRIKEVIVLPSGENISPAEVENKFNEMNCIQDCQIFADYDEGGKVILAIEVLPRMTEAAKEAAAAGEDVGKYVYGKVAELNKTLPPYEQVQKIVIRDSDFERTPAMKIIRYKKVTL